RVDGPVPLVEGVDGLVTDRPHIGLFAAYADCFPLIAHDPRRMVVGLAHAGWRGSAAGIAGSLVAALQREYGTDPAELWVGIGPGICANCYEVGPEFKSHFASEFLRPGTGDRLLVDLAGVNRSQLEQAGVDPARIAGADLCTRESSDLFSHRRQPDGTRFAGLAALA
ncbi:MAG: polyphenol oxidase family protein, partial [Candidatus Dormibacteraeota bacterium]|nr:polyphenol oxidase family protein [Candidatus Dormibacteraeota bacterium]